MHKWILLGNAVNEAKGFHPSYVGRSVGINMDHLVKQKFPSPWRVKMTFVNLQKLCLFEGSHFLLEWV